MPWTGVNQSPFWDETVAVAKKYLDQGHEISITPQRFENGGREHPYPMEYEVYVNFTD